MRRAILPLFTGLLALFATTVAAYPEKRVALVIGNGAYTNATPLPNPRNDAEDVAAALKRAGFETLVGVDLNQSTMQDTVIDFARAAREADVALFYYSGHAMQFAGVNYLMPVDAKLSDEADLRRMARVDDIIADLRQAKNLRILVLDACRDNPLSEQLKRSVGLTRAASLQRGLARIDTPQGMIVAFSTQAQQTAADGEGRNSPYTKAFLKHIETPDEIGRLFRRISTDVYEATERRQLPELSLSLIGEYYLYGEPEAQVAAIAPPQFPVAPPKPVTPALVTPPKPTPSRPFKPGDTFKDCDVCPEMVVLPAGEFIMGSSRGEKDHQPDEGPKHKVQIPAAFAVGKFEVTKDQFEAFVTQSYHYAGQNQPTEKSFRNPGFNQAGNEPAAALNWDDAKQYVEWLTRKTGKKYRLLSEAEWEYAARGGTHSQLASVEREEDLCRHANSADLSLQKKRKMKWAVQCDDGHVFTAPVGSFAANGFGLHDMQGNVAEWVQDFYHTSYSGAPADGSAWVEFGDGPYRVSRGASWYDHEASRFRLARRGGKWVEPKFRDFFNGMRVARTL